MIRTCSRGQNEYPFKISAENCGDFLIAFFLQFVFKSYILCARIPLFTYRSDRTYGISHGIRLYRNTEYPQTGKSVREVLKNKHILSDEEVDQLLDPQTMV